MSSTRKIIGRCMSLLCTVSPDSGKQKTLVIYGNRRPLSKESDWPVYWTDQSDFIEE
ncbi:93_t:CDS:2, partial [Scutellospora calospora]